MTDVAPESLRLELPNDSLEHDQWRSWRRTVDDLHARFVWVVKSDHKATLVHSDRNCPILKQHQYTKVRTEDLPPETGVCRLCGGDFDA